MWHSRFGKKPLCTTPNLLGQPPERSFLFLCWHQGHACQQAWAVFANTRGWQMCPENHRQVACDGHVELLYLMAHQRVRCVEISTKGLPALPSVRSYISFHLKSRDLDPNLKQASQTMLVVKRWINSTLLAALQTWVSELVIRKKCQRFVKMWSSR
jgi:hypothetical protein